MRHLALAALAAAALLACPAAGSAQNTYRATVVSQMDAAGSVFTRQGFRSAPDVFDRNSIVGALAQGATSMLELSLVAGVEYRITGVCDEDCSDLDLRLFAPGSTQATEKDDSDDDVPILAFTAPTTGPYMLAVDMAKCSGSYCYYGYRVYRK
ncbi:MAG TPA: hypothetical protein VF263_24830 [Longimicrobiaceae bacterium]